VEMRWIIRFVSRYAVINPQIKFTLSSGSKKIIDAHKTDSVFKRIYQIYGRDIAMKLLPFEEKDDSLRAYGYCSSPDHRRSNRDWLFFYINGRAVDDKMISHAVNSAYSKLLPPGKYPSVFLFLEVPYDFVDVNVHPTKTEVRFKSKDAIHNIIEDSIRSALIKNSPVMKLQSPAEEKEGFKPDSEKSTEDITARNVFSSYLSDGKAKAGKFPKSTEERESTDRIDTYSQKVQKRSKEKVSNVDKVKPKENGTIQETSEITGPGIREQITEPSASNVIPDLSQRDIRIIGQFDDSFIICQLGEDLLLVDQHVAHERIRYEGLKKSQREDNITSQQLLIPQTFDVSPEQENTLQSIKDILSDTGITVEPFGGKTWVVKSVPEGLRVNELDLMKDILDAFSDIDATDSSDQLSELIIDDTLILIACHGAIKKNQRLTEEKMHWLIENLFNCEEPYRCPHGRPIIIKISKNEIFKKFGRGAHH